MRVDYMMLAPYAELSDDGKVSMLSGDLDTLNIRGQFPGITATPLYLTVRLSFPANECGRQYISQVRVVAPDGATITETEAKPLDTPAPDQGHMETKIRFIIAFAGMLIPAPGEYRIQLLVDNVEQKSIPLYVIALPPA